MTERVEDIVEIIAEALWASPANKRAIKWSAVMGEAREAWHNDALRAMEALNNNGLIIMSAADANRVLRAHGECAGLKEGK